jgi:phage shock protein A
MSIFERIATLTKAAIHEGLNKLEDPVLLTGQYLRDLEEEIYAAEQKEHELKVAAAVLEKRRTEYQLQADRSEYEAVKALETGNADEARAAVFAKLRYEESIQECTAGLEETRNTLIALEASIQKSKEEYTRLKAKRTELAARARKAAETLSVPQSNGHGLGSVNYRKPLNSRETTRGFERMEDKIAEWEVLAEHTNPNFRTAAAIPAADKGLTLAVDAELERLRSRDN